jgi:hypothetical protein
MTGPHDDIVPRRPGPRRGLAGGRPAWLPIAGGLALVAALAAVAAVALASGGDSTPGAAGDPAPSTAAPTAAPSPTTGSRPTTVAGPTTAPVSPTGAGATAAPPVPTVPPVTPAPPPTGPGAPPGTVSSAERDAAIGELVAQGLTGSEATCVVDRTIAQFGDPKVLSDPGVDPQVASRLFEITQDCLFGPGA